MLIVFSSVIFPDRHRTVVSVHFLFYCGLNNSIPKVTNQGVLAIFLLGMMSFNLQEPAYISSGFLACLMQQSKWHLSYSVQAAITECHRMGSSNKNHLFPTILEAYSPWSRCDRFSVWGVSFLVCLWLPSQMVGEGWGSGPL